MELLQVKEELKQKEAEKQAEEKLEALKKWSNQCVRRNVSV
jgi:hypothetical protein